MKTIKNDRLQDTRKEMESHISDGLFVLSAVLGGLLLVVEQVHLLLQPQLLQLHGRVLDEHHVPEKGSHS